MRCVDARVIGGLDKRLADDVDNESVMLALLSYLGET